MISESSTTTVPPNPATTPLDIPLIRVRRTVTSESGFPASTPDPPAPLGSRIVESSTVTVAAST